MAEIFKTMSTDENQGPTLITGANGLVGRAAVEQLSPARKVYALVRKMPDQPFSDPVTPVVYDLRQSQDMELPEIPDTIIHLAQSSRHRDFPDGALDVFDVNVGSTQRLLEWGCRHGVKRFVYASSGGVYGPGDKAWEESASIDPMISLDHYNASKRSGELLANAYRNYMTVIVLRFFFVYGPGQRRIMLIPRLLESVANGRPIMLQGTNGIRLNPIYVDDAAASVAAAAQLEQSETINVVGPEVLTLREIGSLMGEVMGHVPQFDCQTSSSPKNLFGCAHKMDQLLGASRISMAEGLTRMKASNQFASLGGGDGD